MITFNTKGLDFALTALFVVLFLEQWKKKENRPAGVIGIVCAAASLLLGAFNLLPLWPLDGGRLLRAALTAAFGLRGEAAAAVIGRTFCAALLLTALTLTLLHRAGPWPLIAAGVTFLRLLLMRREEKVVAFPRAKR